MKEINPVTELRKMQSYMYQKTMAEVFNVSQAFMSKVMRGEKPPNKAMLDSIGLRRVVERKVSYVRVNKCSR